MRSWSQLFLRRRRSRSATSTSRSAARSALYYLPLTITERLGYFKDEGLNVRISDFAGGTRSLEAVVGGSADVVSGSYEHTINMQSKKIHFQAFVLSGASPQISVGIATSSAANYKSPKDLKGLQSRRQRAGFEHQHGGELPHRQGRAQAHRRLHHRHRRGRQR